LWEDWRVTSRSRIGLTFVVGPLTFTFLIALCGCGDAFHAGSMSYVESPEMVAKLGDKPEMKTEERAKAAALRKEVQDAVAALFGPDPAHMKVPQGSGLPAGGRHLASHVEETPGQIKLVKMIPKGGSAADAVKQEGGYGLYRKHCLHCHGVSGAGDGPTSAFLFPRPRDYRAGKFKFTSTISQHKPARDDLRRTIRNGLHGTSMPAFEALMSNAEIEQVIDYMTFLSMRGETELSLIEEAATSAELPKEAIADVVGLVFKKWKDAEHEVENPPVDRTPPTRESVLRGRELFLGKTTHRLECTGCHGAQAVGNGPSMVAMDVFNNVVFGGNPSAMGERLARYDDKTKELWKNSLDEWGNPLRPANLNRGVYKGGRRPIDIYWRIAKGINGAKMPAHYPAVDPEKIWDIVNFVLALPYEPSLLDGATLPAGLPVPGTTTPPKPAVASQ
jgi:mono/diheme cytochrome c family protein